jgi:hypothetical protein
MERLGHRKSIIGSVVNRHLQECQQATTMLFYVPPHKLLRVLTDMQDIMGADRQCCVAREITKIHETFLRGSFEEVIKHIEEKAVKGEITLIVEGSSSVGVGETQGFGGNVRTLLWLYCHRSKSTPCQCSGSSFHSVLCARSQRSKSLSFVRCCV